MTDSDLQLLRAKLASVDETIAWCDGLLHQRGVSYQRRCEAMVSQARLAGIKSDILKAIAGHTLPATKNL